MLKKNLVLAVRILRRDWVLTAIGVLAIGASIGAVNATISVCRAFLIETHPYQRPSGIVTIGPMSRWQNGAIGGTSVPNYLDIRQLSHSYSTVGLTIQSWANLATNDQPERARLMYTSPSMFGITGIKPQIGRIFSEDEVESGQTHVAVIGSDLWRNAFGSSPTVLGRTIRLDQVPYTIIGVLETDKYVIMRSYQIYVPAVLTPELRAASNRNKIQCSMFGRLLPNVTLASAQSELDLIRDQIVVQYPDLARTWNSVEEPVALKVDTVNHNVFKFGWSIMPIAAISFLVVALTVLAVCGLNLTTMLLSRVSARQKEFSVRTALGASYRDLGIQLATENAVLYALGGACGVVFSYGIIQGLRAIGVEAFDIGGRIRIDWPIATLGVAICIALGAGLSLLPLHVIRSHDVAQTLKSGGGNSSLSRGRIRTLSGMIVVQIAVSFVLMVLTWLLSTTSRNLLNADPGFAIDDMEVAQITLPDDRYRDDRAVLRFLDPTLDRIRAVPGVKSAGMISSMPFLIGVQQEEVKPSATAETGRKNRLYIVSEGALETLRVPLVKGRLLSRKDDLAAEHVVVIDTQAEALLYAGESAIGKRIQFRDQSYVVVGVVRPMKHFSLTESLDLGAIYFSERQWYAPKTCFLVARYESDAGGIARSIGSFIRLEDPELPKFEVTTMRDFWNRGFSSRDAMSKSLMIAAALAVLLASMGTAGMFAFFAKLCANELGIRVALGAGPAQVAWAALRRAPGILAAGLGCGSALSMVFAYLARGMLYQVSAFNPLIIIACGALITLVSVAACLPALVYSLRVNPIQILRSS